MIVALTLAKRLEQILPEITHLDQTGIELCQTQDSIIRTSHVIHLLNYEQTEAAKMVWMKKKLSIQ